MRVLGEITESKRSEEELGEAKKSLAKLSNRRSYIMIALLNLAWCCLQSYVLGIGMHSWEKSSVESIDFVDNIWNVVSVIQMGIMGHPQALACGHLWDDITTLKYKERLPARPAFYKYITCMLALNGLSLFACALAANGAHFGLWLYGITSVCYHSFYLPLLYVTFLADFFQEEDLNLENVYYSEMKDAGFFDADWE
ncbi:unnamed protein product [Brassica napus]|uniref:(rape) hypothetical protein n=1 Tax=Brassica napus TaxID=3708 RepID=A0A816LIB4_BRANA|nr:unnamed protein product [Brassica napus]